MTSAPTRLARLRRALSTAVGAAIALAMLLALGVWFYRLGARDAESVPIIRASSEPTKTRPEEPGGSVTPYQEITSYEVAGSVETDTAAVMAPPPPQPRREDAPMGTLAPLSAGQADKASPAPPASPRRPVEAPVARTPPATAPGDPPVEEPEIAEVPGAVSEDAAPSEADEIAALVRQATLEVAVAPKPEPGEAPPDAGDAPFAPLPPTRPADLRARIEASLRSAEESAAALTRSAAESPVQIQLAADPDEAAVRAMWQRISRANSDILHNRELAVQKTVSGGTTFYRLRVGPFGGASEARAVCQALRARGQDCIVARNG